MDHLIEWYLSVDIPIFSDMYIYSVYLIQQNLQAKQKHIQVHHNYIQHYFKQYSQYNLSTKLATRRVTQIRLTLVPPSGPKKEMQQRHSQQYTNVTCNTTAYHMMQGSTL